MPSAVSEPSRLALSVAQINALVAELARFNVAIRTRGQRYAVSRRVGPLNFDGECVRATVRGTDIYETHWVWSGDNWEPDCSCPAAPYCKHAYAVACHIIAGSRTQAAYADTRLERLVPAALLSDPQRSQQDFWQPAGTPQPRRSAPARQSPPLERLRATQDPWTRQRLFGRLVQQAVTRGLNPYLEVFTEILEETDADLLCWRLAAEIAKRTGDWLPPDLEPYRSRRDLADRYAERGRLGLARDLVQWATQQRKTAQRRLRALLGLTRQPSGRVVVTVQARLTTPRTTDAPRTSTQLQQLRNELRRTPGLLPHDHALLLEWLADHNLGGADTHGFAYTLAGPYATNRALSGTALKALVASFTDTAAVSWGPDIDAALAARAGVSAGAPLRLSAHAARLLPTCMTRDGALCVDFMFLWPDGRQRPLDAVVYLPGTAEWSRSHPSFVLADGEFSFVIEEPPAALLERFEQVGGLPIPSTQRVEVLGLLAAKFPHLQDTLATHTRFYAVTPVIALDLRNDDWLQIRLFAHTSREPWSPSTPPPGDVVVFEYTPEQRWARQQRVDSAPTVAADVYADIAGTEAPDATDANDDADVPAEITEPAATVDANDLWFEAPDAERVAAAVEWLVVTQAAPGTKGSPSGREPAWPDRHVGWWLQVTRKRMEAFAEAWEERPRAAAYYGTERVRRLLSGELRVTPLLHIESSGMDWFAVSAKWEAEGRQLSDADLAALRAATTRFVKLSSGWVRRETATVHDEAALLLADLGIEAGQGEQRLSLWQLAGAKPESLQALARFGADADTLRAAQGLRERVAAFTGLPHVPPAASLQVELRPYQQRGLDFLSYTSSLGIGAVLADDMGLGKTVQALAWLVHLREVEPEGGPALVVCPASVVHNWEREAARFAPTLKVLLLTSGQTRHELRDAIPSHDLIVTNYALLRRDVEAWRKVDLRAVILDEAQNIKNPDAVVTRAVQSLRARHRLALTGTPLENRALDLWSIVHTVNPGYLGNRAQFQSRFDRLDAPPHVRTLLAAKLRPVLLRRTKNEVAPELPERIEERCDCELTKDQRALYLAELRRSRALVEQLADAPGGIAQNKIHILAALTRLRQICCHPALAGGKKSLGSGKFDALFEMLEPLLAEGHKVLLFSQFVECLKLLESELKERDIASHKLTGQTVKRQQVVDAFQNDPHPSVFLISLKAGGTGLNLTAASYVVLFDPWWNPAVEAQAIDRTHRIGQDRTVIAYRMLTRGTIEEKIWELQQRKAALARDILGEGGFARALTRGDLDYLLAET